MSESAGLERAYRRLIACYPRSFRRENEEEIVTVLLATAPEGQRRPGITESADLIRGAIRMRMGLSRTPRTVLNAVRLMYLGAVAELGVVVALWLTEGSIRAAVSHRYPQLTPTQLDGLNGLFTFEVVVGSLVVLLWLFMAWAIGKGSQLARLAAVFCFSLSTLGIIVDASTGSPQFAPAAFTGACLLWLIGLAAIVNLFRKQSRAYYERQAALRPPSPPPPATTLSSGYAP
jgi:hypothetical protein